MSLRRIAIHLGLRVHKTEGSVGAFQGIRLTLALEDCV
jgi:hypothetical protein